MKFLGRIMRKECLANLTLKGQKEGKRSKTKQSAIYLMSLHEWIEENKTNSRGSKVP